MGGMYIVDRHHFGCNRRWRDVSACRGKMQVNGESTTLNSARVFGPWRGGPRIRRGPDFEFASIWGLGLVPGRGLDEYRSKALDWHRAKKTQGPRHRHRNNIRNASPPWTGSAEDTARDGAMRRRLRVACTSHPGAERPKVSAGEPGKMCQK